MNQYDNIPAQQGLRQKERCKVSVIVPVYNQGEFLAEALDSVLQQTYSNWECVIVNDGSTDNSEEVAKSYLDKDNRFKYLYQENSRLAAARNNGIWHSDGYYILPLDSDNVLCPAYLEKAVSYFLLHPETTLVYGKAELFGDRSGIWNLPEYSWEKIIWSNCIDACAMYKRSDFEAIGGYRDVLMEDWDFWLSLLKPDSVVYRYDDVLFRYRVRTESLGSGASNKNKLEATTTQICENHKEIYAPYQSKILYFGISRLIYENYYEDMKKKYEHVLDTKAYRLGKKLLQPLMWLRDRL